MKKESRSLEKVVWCEETDQLTFTERGLKLRGNGVKGSNPQKRRSFGVI